MKKYLISLILFFSLFLFTNNVKAISSKKLIFDYNSDFIQNQVLTDDVVDYIDNYVIPYLDSSENRSQFEYVITLDTGYNFGSNNYPPIYIYFIQNVPDNRKITISNFLRNSYSNYLEINRINTSNLDSNFYYSGVQALYYSQVNPSKSNVSNKDLSIFDSFLNDPSGSMSSIASDLVRRISIISGSVNDSNDFTLYSSKNGSANNKMIYYSSVDIINAVYNNNNFLPYFRNIDVIYNDNTYSFGLGDEFPSYKNFIDNLSVTVNKVIDLGDNTFGFFQDYVGLNLTSLSGAVDTLSVVCEQDRPFNNNYCFINYNDLINHNSDINVFNDYGVSFTQLFGSNTGYLLNDRFYLYSFRIQKPFVPQVGNLFINSLTNNSNQVDILGVYLQDGGSYTDYVIKFKISNSDYTSNTSLKDITVVFRDGLSSYFSTIPTSFNYSVYRSFKLQYFSTEPTMEQVNNFYNSNDLSSIDGISSNNSFFTDNDFNTFGFGGIITAPFRFLYAIENYESCTDIVLPFPHSNNTITLSCVRNSIPSSINPLISILQIILSGFISYRIAVETLAIIKDISSPDVANIEVVDL